MASYIPKNAAAQRMQALLARKRRKNSKKSKKNPFLNYKAR